MNQNLTVRLESDTIRKAEAYEQARVEALTELESGHDLGSRGHLPPREDVHER